MTRGRTLPVLASTLPVSCAPLHGTLSLGACVKRYLAANASERTKVTAGWNHYGLSRDVEKYISCRKCADGRQRTHNQQEGKR